MQAVGLQTYIWNNNLRSIFLLAGFPFLLLVLLYAVELTLLGSGFSHAPYGHYVTLGDEFAYAVRLTVESAPAGHRRGRGLVRHRLFRQPGHHRPGDRFRAGRAQGRAGTL